MYEVVAEADVSLAERRVLHAGRYEDTYSNYVAAERCLYNCVYLIEHQNYTKDQLKEYIHNHYNREVQLLRLEKIYVLLLIMRMIMCIKVHLYPLKK